MRFCRGYTKKYPGNNVPAEIPRTNVSLNKISPGKIIPKTKS